MQFYFPIITFRHKYIEIGSLVFPENLLGIVTCSARWVCMTLFTLAFIHFTDIHVYFAAVAVYLNVDT